MLQGIPGTPDPALGDFRHRFQRQVAALGHALEEGAIGEVHRVLQGAGQLRLQGAVQAHRTGHRCGPHPVGVHPRPLEQLLEGGKGGKHADAAGEGGRGRQHPVGAGGNVVAAGGRQRPHGGHHRQAVGADIGDRLVNQFRRKSTAPAAVDPQHNRRHILALGSGVQQAGQAVAANAARRLVAGEDVALGDNHRNALALGPGLHRRPLVGDIALEAHGLVEAILVGRPDALHQVVVALLVAEQLVHQASFQGQARGIALYRRQALGVVGHIGVDAAVGEAAAGLHLGRVLAPEIAQPALGDGLFRGRHVVAQEGLGHRLVFAGAEDVHRHRQLVQGLGEMVAVAGKALQGDGAEGMHEDFIRLAGHQVLVLGEVIRHRDHRFAAGAKGLHRRGNVQVAAEPGPHHQLGLDHQCGDGGVVGGQPDGIQHIPQQDFTVRRAGGAGQCLQGRQRALFLHQHPHRVDQQGSLRRQRLLGVGEVEKINQHQGADEQQIGQRQPEPGKQAPQAGEQAAQQGGGSTHADSGAGSDWRSSRARQRT